MTNLDLHVLKEVSNNCYIYIFFFNIVLKNKNAPVRFRPHTRWRTNTEEHLKSRYLS